MAAGADDGFQRGRPNSVLQDKYGFKFLELKGGELLCRFEREGFFQAEWLNTVVDQLTWLAATIK